MIVIIDSDPNATLPYRKRLFRLRVHSLCLTPENIHRIAEYPANGILIIHPERIDRVLDLCASLRSLYPHLPVAAIYRQPGMNYYHLKNAVDLLLHERSTTPKTISAIYELYRAKGNPDTRSCIADCVRTDTRSPFVYVLGHPFLPTHTQWMLVRYLTMAAPRAVPVEELLALCFAPGGSRSPRNVSAQLTQLDRIIYRGFGFRVFLHQYPSSYSIQKIIS